MKLRWLVFALSILIMTQSAIANPNRLLMMVEDSDGYSNIRLGPSTDFSVEAKIKDGEIVEVYFDPQVEDIEARYPDQVWVWDRSWNAIPNCRDWVAVWPMRAGPSSYNGRTLVRANVGLIHRSRLKPVPQKTLATVFINDPDGYVNIRKGPGTQFPVCAELKLDETAFALWDDKYAKEPYYGEGWLSKNKSKLGWVKILNRKGVIGYVHHSRIDVHDSRGAGILRYEAYP